MAIVKRPKFGANPAIFMVPFAVFLVGMMIMPLVQVFNTSLTDGPAAFAGYREALTSPLILRVLLTTIEIAAVSSIITLLIAYPIAYHLSRQTPRRRAYLIVFVLLPFWTSILVKSYAFLVILGHDGIVNTVLGWIFYENFTLKLIYNRIGVVVGMSHFLLPFMIFPILANLLTQRPELRRAAYVMGAGRLLTFWRVTFPLSFSGVISGSIICMTLCLGMFVTPALLGGSEDLMISNMIDFYVREIADWNMAAVLSVILLVLSCGLLGLLLSYRGASGLIGDNAEL